MSDFGGRLRLARERRGVSLRQVAASTKIPVVALEALERNDVSKLPGGIFSRAFVRAYAVEVGLDPGDTVREFLERFESEPVPSGAGSVAIAEEDSSFESQQRMAGVLLTIVMVSVPLVGAILYFTLRGRPPDRSSTPAPMDQSSAAPVSSAQDRPPLTVAPSVPAPPLKPSPPVLKPMKLVLHPTGDCWVGLTVDGERVMARLMLAGEKEVRDVRDTAVIEIGNAGAFAFSIDGRPGKTLGEQGQVRTARITRNSVREYVQ
jgi:cytoskeletal protein RodZ